MQITKNGSAITDLDDWGRRAGPKRLDHWVEGRSAMETARYWLNASAALPDPFAAALAAHPDFGPVLKWAGEPEVRLRFDKRKGEPRNTDMLLDCVDERGDFLMAIEAKADESFGETVAEGVAAALERRISNPRSQAYARIADLATSLLPKYSKGGPAVGDLRYQLLTATAGGLAEGARRGVARAVLAVQEFRTSKTDDRRHARNAADFDRFVRRVSDGRHSPATDGSLIGPIEVPGAPLFQATPNLYLLKIVCDLRHAR